MYQWYIAIVFVSILLEKDKNTYTIMYAVSATIMQGDEMKTIMLKYKEYTPYEIATVRGFHLSASSGPPMMPRGSSEAQIQDLIM